MIHQFNAESDDQVRLDEAELERFNTYYSNYVKIGARPLSLQEAELVLQLMSVEQRWALMNAIRRTR